MTLGPDLILDPDTHDLELIDGDLVLAVDVAQAVSIALQFVAGEWFLNRDAGVPYYDEIFVKSPNLDLVATIFRDTILAVPGVNAIQNFLPDFDTDARRYDLVWSADTDEGEVEGTEVFFF